MIEELLPADVAAEEAYDDLPDSVLYEQEMALVADAVEQRRREFATVRGCARTALARLGVEPAPILPGRRGAPTWPQGVVGSMTHCAGYRAAALARADRLTVIGIDAEPNQPIASRGALELVTVEQERQWLARLAADRPEVSWDRLVFSAKESVYKVWYPLTGRSLEFEDAVVTVDPDAGTFHARLLVPGPTVAGARLTALRGRWTTGRGLVITAIALPAHHLDCARTTAVPHYR
ncbi:4'-phosphopantetheinyl transferase EntD [Kitasatospora sp. MAA4]|uniref:4'-phosphopantetheinyl transferase family protein n=1 Tax=Kitasatospora sp. MAA4 TaxID=3035093 RepID=UPI00247586BF|nr:4'-phosphopantetheinyl transferase superfamily protein [Kitasatospora sp. MAA4]MDH6131113.1 4'-phosphopantetheinyl transferase EntD [Kitasatospora sp. MAA4]